MIRSVFAVSGFATVVGLMTVFVAVGCSDEGPESTSIPTEPDNQTGAKPPRAPHPPPTVDQPEVDDTPPPVSACMDTTPFDATAVPYRSPRVKAGSCTAADIKVFDDYIRDNPQATFEDVKATLEKQSKRCSDCAFGGPDEETWAPIVVDDTMAIVNGGGCVSRVSGKDACGKAYQQWNTCLNTVCASCTDADDNKVCKNEAQMPEGPCGTSGQALFDACGRSVNDYLKKCFGNGFGAVIEQSCGAPARDGGV